MPRLRTSDLTELGCVTYMTVREHQRQAHETEIILDRVRDIAERAESRLDTCPETLRSAG
jgi:hypothetical protein